MSVATLRTGTDHGGETRQERFVRVLASVQRPRPVESDPREHRLTEAIVVPLPRRVALDTPDW
ncbi:MAG TPA: hypothetical protein VF529_17535 [Solirubrobacteraceae bacterium]|jgi:hypothetical protein